MLGKEVHSEPRECASEAIPESRSGHLGSKNWPRLAVAAKSQHRQWVRHLSRQATEAVKPRRLGNMGIQIQVRIVDLKGSSIVPCGLRKKFQLFPTIGIYHS